MIRKLWLVPLFLFLLIPTSARNWTEPVLTRSKLTSLDSPVSIYWEGNFYLLYQDTEGTLAGYGKYTHYFVEKYDSDWNRLYSRNISYHKDTSQYYVPNEAKACDMWIDYKYSPDKLLVVCAGKAYDHFDDLPYSVQFWTLYNLDDLSVYKRGEFKETQTSEYLYNFPAVSNFGYTSSGGARHEYYSIFRKIGTTNYYYAKKETEGLTKLYMPDDILSVYEAVTWQDVGGTVLEPTDYEYLIYAGSTADVSRGLFVNYYSGNFSDFVKRKTLIDDMKVYRPSITLVKGDSLHHLMYVTYPEGEVYEVIFDKDWNFVDRVRVEQDRFNEFNEVYSPRFSYDTRWERYYFMYSGMENESDYYNFTERVSDNKLKESNYFMPPYGKALNVKLQVCSQYSDAWVGYIYWRIENATDYIQWVDDTYLEVSYTGDPACLYRGVREEPFDWMSEFSNQTVNLSIWIEWGYQTGNISWAQFKYRTTPYSSIYRMFEPIVCTCTDWTDQECVGELYRKQTRFCTPIGCNDTVRYVTDPECESIGTYKFSDYTSCESDWIKINQSAECTASYEIPPDCSNVSSTAVGNLFFETTVGCAGPNNYTMRVCNPETECDEYNISCAEAGDVPKNKTYDFYAGGEVATGRTWGYVPNLTGCNCTDEFMVTNFLNLTCDRLYYCEPEWVCKDNMTKAYQRRDCKLVNLTHCPYGCEAGECLVAPKPPTPPITQPLEPIPTVNKTAFEEAGYGWVAPLLTPFGIFMFLSISLAVVGEYYAKSGGLLGGVVLLGMMLAGTVLGYIVAWVGVVFIVLAGLGLSYRIGGVFFG